MSVDEAPTATLTALVMNELDMIDTRPPQDEYAAVHEHPPAYGIFEDIYAQWHAANKAKQALVALDNDPAVATAGMELKNGEELLKEMKRKRRVVFKSNLCPIRKRMVMPSIRSIVQRGGIQGNTYQAASIHISQVQLSKVKAKIIP